MKIAIISDLHLEYHKDKGAAFIVSLDPTDIDVLILAGDISEINHINFAIEKFCEKYPVVLMVSGNHEYYTSDAGNVLFSFENLEEQFPNFHFLDNNIFELNGKRFLGTTLWYRFVNPALSWKWSDFRFINDFESWVYKESDKGIKFLEDNLKENDIVISHFLPSPKLIAPQHEGDPTNVFYVCNVEKLIEERKPSHWFFGHTHTAMDVKIGQTRLVCNPRGYINKNTQEPSENTGFNDKCVIEI